MRISQQLNRLGMLAAAIIASVAPQRADAHGETLIRIATLSRKISAATTNAALLYLSRGDLYREHQDWVAAEADYAQAAKLQSDLAAVDLCRAHLLADMNKWPEAEAMFTKTLARAPKEGEALIGRARVLLKLNRRPEVITDFSRGLELLSAPPPEYFLEFAQALVAEKRPSEALRALDDGIKRLGPLVPLLEQALQLELENKDLAAALRRVDRIIEVAPRKESWFARRGDIQLLANRPAAARQSYNAALKAIDALPPILRKSSAVLQLIDHVRITSAQVASRIPQTSQE